MEVLYISMQSNAVQCSAVQRNATHNPQPISQTNQEDQTGRRYYCKQIIIKKEGKTAETKWVVLVLKSGLLPMELSIITVRFSGLFFSLHGTALTAQHHLLT
jgi:hypothetical protein